MAGPRATFFLQMASKKLNEAHTMTSYEFESASVLVRAETGSDMWSKVLGPLLAAALVLALGLVLVGVTSQDEAAEPPPSRPAAASYVTP